MSDEPRSRESSEYPRPVRLGTTQTLAVELAPGIYRLMAKRVGRTGKAAHNG